MEGPMEEDVEEADAEMDVGEVPPTGVSVPEQAPGTTGDYAGDGWHLGEWSKWPGGRARHQLEGSGKGAHRTGRVATPGQDG